MAASPRYKVYLDSGNGMEYVASVKEPGMGALITAFFGHGQVRTGHTRVVWDEKTESTSAHESYDDVTDIILKRDV